MENISITKEEEEIANREAIYLYGYLRKKYANDTVKDLDIIMNSLCFALCKLIEHHVKPTEAKYLIEIINNIITKQFTVSKHP